MADAARERLLILGGGLIGLTMAHELARKGFTIEVISRQKTEAAGFGAAGMLAPHAEGLTGNHLELGLLSLQLIPEWVKKIEKDSGLSCGYRNCGIIVPFLNIKEAEIYPTSYLGLILNRKELEAEIPGISQQWKSGLLFNKDGQIDNRRKLMLALEKACVALGVKFREGVEVIKLIEQKQEIQGVEVKNTKGLQETIWGQRAILCSGAWSQKILTDLPLFPVKGEMLSIQGPKNSLKRIIYGPGTYLVPREDDLIIVGATSNKEARFNKGITQSGQLQLKNGINSLLPIANQWPPIDSWWGFRPGTPDEMPILGKSRLKGLWLATGHYRNGVLLAAITAKLISKCILKDPLTQKESELLMSFNWNRFNKYHASTRQ